jgi:hypothetical protein
VTVTVTEVKHGISTVLQPNEKGKFDVVVANNGSVRLTNLIYEPSISPGDVAKLISPSGIVMGAREGLDPSSDLIPNGQETTKMFLFPLDALNFASVDPGETVTNPELQVTTQRSLAGRRGRPGAVGGADLGRGGHELRRRLPLPCASCRPSPNTRSTRSNTPASFRPAVARGDRHPVPTAGRAPRR